mmetsp:Transcript_33140/g.80086  ORF Transcript_33140/g.80086 Transcript_33140/m.80086 type:complete len:207 (+) Transcript_33140:828-1448(+)
MDGNWEGVEDPETEGASLGTVVPVGTSECDGGEEGAFERLGCCDTVGVFEATIVGNNEGFGDGTMLGRSDGMNDGAKEGTKDGSILGSMDGDSEGVCEAKTVGCILGLREGEVEGACDGSREGSRVGPGDGGLVGDGVRFGAVNPMKIVATSSLRDIHSTLNSSPVLPLKLRILSFWSCFISAIRFDVFASSLVSFIVTSTLSFPN